VKKKLSEYGWLEQMSRRRQGITVDGIEYVPPHKKHRSCDGCWFLFRKSNEPDDGKGYGCRAGCDLIMKKSGSGYKPAGICIPCKDATSKGPERAKELLEVIKRRCKEEDDTEQLYMEMEKHPYFGGNK